MDVMDIESFVYWLKLITVLQYCFQ